ncbi:MAG TPA: hypothetical protein VG963_26080 [Polyangiaceae bacterium]|nr:hypothetical protein [Polyangiaceae bacterium]
MSNAPWRELMVYPSSPDPTVHSPAASTRLLETGVELIRAEVAVALARARQAATRGLAALLLTLLAAAMLQVALVVGVLAPLLVHTLPSHSVWLAVALPGGLALVSLCGAAVAWVSLQRSLRKSTNAVVASHETAQTEESARGSRRSSSPMLIQLKEERTQQ